MSQRAVVFLGTASQVPTRTRSHNALFLFWDELGILFDPGEGAQRQMTLAGISSSQVTHIVLTHFHGDHCLGLPGVLQRLSLDRVEHEIGVYYPASGRAYFERMRLASLYHEAARIDSRPLIVEPDTEVEILRSGKFRLFARLLDHGVDCLGYRLQEEDGRRMLPERLSALGVVGPSIGELQRLGRLEVGPRTVRIEEVSEAKPGQSFALTLDTRPCASASALARGADLLVCEATYLDSERQEAHEHFHMTAGQAAALARDAGVRRLALTHFSQRYTETDAFRTETAPLHSDVVIAADLDRVAVPPRG
jgi:ribonuclease Z